MRRYQTGGLAAAMGPPAPEEQMGPEQPAPAITADQLLERTTGGIRPGMGLTEMIMMNKQSALDRLRQGQQRIIERKTQRQQDDERNRWLAVAQAMLAPTRTGAFGESLGVAAGALREQNAAAAEAQAAMDAELDNMAAAEIAVESQAIEQLLKQVGYGNQAKGIHGSIETMVHPDDVNKPIANQRIVFGAVQRRPDGSWGLAPLLDEDGGAFIAADRLEPARAAALISATNRAESASGRSEEFINTAYGVKGALTNVRRANEILENAETIIETSGLQGLKNRLANFVGVDLGDTVELTELQMLIAEDYLTKLTNLKGSSSDRDVMEMKGISVGMGQNTTANYRRLRQMQEIYEASIRRGIREAWNVGTRAEDPNIRENYMDTVADLWESAAGNRWVPGARPIKATRAAYDRLDPGTWFFIEDDWGGIVRQKPEEPVE